MAYQAQFTHSVGLQRTAFVHHKMMFKLTSIQFLTLQHQTRQSVLQRMPVLQLQTPMALLEQHSAGPYFLRRTSVVPVPETGH
jgi:hypothetical protein